MEAVRDRLNPEISEREALIVREGRQFAGNQTPTTGTTSRGRSSLGISAHVAAVTPVLVEMGQENQDVDRRISLHLLIGRAMLEEVGVL